MVTVFTITSPGDAATAQRLAAPHDILNVRDTGPEVVSLRELCARVHVENATVEVGGAAEVHAYDGSTVHARDYVHVSATRDAVVHARDQVTVRATLSPAGRVHARDHARVSASGDGYVTIRGDINARVLATDNVTVTAYGRARAAAYDDVRVTASDSARVLACGHSTVHAYGDATVHAYASSTIRGYARAVIYRCSEQATAAGGTVTDVYRARRGSARLWAEQSGAAADNEYILVCAAVDDEFMSGLDDELPGGIVEAREWPGTDPEGIPFSAWPTATWRYDKEHTRYVRCAIPADESIPLGDRIKAPWYRVLHEVNQYGAYLSHCRERYRVLLDTGSGTP